MASDAGSLCKLGYYFLKYWVFWSLDMIKAESWEREAGTEHVMNYHKLLVCQMLRMDPVFWRSTEGFHA